MNILVLSKQLSTLQTYLFNQDLAGGGGMLGKLGGKEE